MFTKGATGNSPASVNPRRALVLSATHCYIRRLLSLRERSGTERCGFTLRQTVKEGHGWGLLHQAWYCTGLMTTFWGLTRVSCREGIQDRLIEGNGSCSSWSY